MQRPIVDEDAERIAQDFAQHLGAFDLGADRGSGPDEGRCRSGEDDFIARFENGLPVRFDVIAGTDDSLDDDTMTNTIFDRTNRLSGSYRDAVSPRLEFLVPEISTFRRFAAGKFGFQLGGFLLEIDAHEPGCDKGHKHQGQDVAKNVGHGITRRDIRLLLTHDVVGQIELRKRARRRSNHGRLGESAGRKTGSCARIQMKGKSEGENEGKTGEGHDHGHADLRQRPDAQRSKEFGPRLKADREYEQAEEDRFEQGRNDEVSELSKYHGHDQRARRRADRKSGNSEPPKKRAESD